MKAKQIEKDKLENIKMEKNVKIEKNKVEWLLLVILLLYPLRHIHWGLDLWDTGYNYANFAYMGLEHMDSMWLYSTYLANVAGHFLTLLPLGDSLIGMNFYTGLFISGLALAGYFFCTRKLRLPVGICFLGEMIAISLCWCPTALLYNYLTYVLFLSCVSLLYLGLTKKKMWYLFLAGICLGTNVLVRFSNLPEAALILAVWAYALIEARQEKRKGAFKQGVRHTLWCLFGYLSALLVLFAYIHIRYGLDEYIAGILRLFAMTDKATDYKATAMIMKVVGTYVENLYWVIRIAVIIVGGLFFFGVIHAIARRLDGKHNKKQLLSMLAIGAKLLWGVVAIAMLLWLYLRKFCSFHFYSYDSMLRPGILFLMLTMFIAVIRIFHPDSNKEEKLISGLILLVVLLTSIGSNNGIFPSLNNLFIAAPYTLGQCYQFFVKVKTYQWKGIVIDSFPVKGILASFLALFMFQILSFGSEFVFAEATGVQNATTIVENNNVLKGIRMSPEKALWMQEINDFVNEQRIKGKEVILYGDIPALSFYLEMPSSFNPWSDLDSYNIETMKQDLEDTVLKMTSDSAKRPVVIVEKAYGLYLQEAGDKVELKQFGVAEKKIEEMIADEKWQLLTNFMEEHQYKKSFENEKFVVYE